MSKSEFDRVREAISITEDGTRLFVENFVVVATVTNADGAGQIHTLSDCDHAWQVLGMLRHAQLVTEVDKYHNDEDDEL